MFFKLYFIALPILLLIDGFWLGFVARNFYSQQIGDLIKTNMDWLAVAVFYPLFVAGLVIFVIGPAVEKNSWTQALLLGAFFGLIAYATYDLTNLATLKNWPLLVTIVDIAWGTFVVSLVSVLTFFVASQI